MEKSLIWLIIISVILLVVFTGFAILKKIDLRSFMNEEINSEEDGNSQNNNVLNNSQTDNFSSSGDILPPIIGSSGNNGSSGGSGGGGGSGSSGGGGGSGSSGQGTSSRSNNITDSINLLLSGNVTDPISAAGLMDYVIENGKNNWTLRSSIIYLDNILVPQPDVNPTLHYLTNPDWYNLVRSYFNRRIIRMKNEITGGSLPPNNCIKITAGYSSSHIITLPDGYRFALDFAFFPYIDYLNGNPPISLEDFTAIGAALDASYITHRHNDHWDPGTLYSMRTANPSSALVAPLQWAQTVGANPSTITIPQNDTVFTLSNNGNIQTIAYVGAQGNPSQGEFYAVTNFYLIKINLPSGHQVVIADGGEIEDTGVINWLSQKELSGWEVDISFNLGTNTNSIVSNVLNDNSDLLRVNSHLKEFSHLGSSFIMRNINQNSPLWNDPNNLESINLPYHGLSELWGETYLYCK